MATICVVDDNIDNITLLSWQLEDDGHRVVSAGNGQEALAMIKSSPPDAVLLDLRMPGMSGLEVCRLLKADPLTQQIPVIIVSSDDEDEDIIAALDIGAHDYVVKPYRYEILSARLRSALRLKESIEKLADLNKRLEELAAKDPLTALFNRREYFSRSVVELARAWRHDTKLSVLVMDVDHFKRINDKYGHAAGDAALVFLSYELTNEFRQMDIIGRLGGEEFGITLPTTEFADAWTIAERFRKHIASKSFTVQGQNLQLTLSIGVSTLQHEDRQFSDVLERADKALYIAKNGGRNQVSPIPFEQKSGERH